WACCRWKRWTWSWTLRASRWPSIPPTRTFRCSRSKHRRSYDVPATERCATVGASARQEGTPRASARIRACGSGSAEIKQDIERPAHRSRQGNLVSLGQLNPVAERALSIKPLRGFDGRISKVQQKKRGAQGIAELVNRVRQSTLQRPLEVGTANLAAADQ